MDSKDFVKNDSGDVRLMSPAERSALQTRIVREARIARAAAIGKTFCSLAAGLRAFGAVNAARQRRRLEKQAVAELKAFSDYALSDLGIVRSEIDQRVRFPKKTAARKRI